MVERHGVPADPDPAMGRPARDVLLLRPATVARQGAHGAGAADQEGQGGPASRPESVQAQPQDRRLSGAHPGDRRAGRRVQPHRHSRSRGDAQAGARAPHGAEQAVWELDQRINARGIAIDVGFVQAAKRIADQVDGRGDRGIRPADRRPFAPSGAKDPSVAEGPQMGLAQSRKRDGQRGARARRASRRRAAGAGDQADRRRDQLEEARRHARLRRRRWPGPRSSAVSRRVNRAVVRAIDPAAELSAGRRSRRTSTPRNWRPRSRPAIPMRCAAGASRSTCWFPGCAMR